MAVYDCEVCGKTMFPRYCPHCGVMVDADMPVAGAHRHPTPEQDVSICVFCSGLSIFTDNGLRLPTDEEWRRAMANEETRRAIAVLSMMRRDGVIPNAREE